MLESDEMSEDEEDSDDTLEDDDSSNSWQPLSITALAFLFLLSACVRLILSCLRSGSMLCWLYELL